MLGCICICICIYKEPETRQTPVLGGRRSEEAASLGRAGGLCWAAILARAMLVAKTHPEVGLSLPCRVALCAYAVVCLN